jgi:hypothetical protein
MKKWLQPVVCFQVIFGLSGFVLGELDDDARKLLRKELEELSGRRQPQVEPAERGKMIEDLRRQTEAQQKEIEDLKRELEKAKKVKRVLEPPAWGKEILVQLNSLKALVSQGVNIKTYLERLSHAESKIQKTMREKEARPLNEKVTEILSLYHVAGEIWKWKVRPENRHDAKDRTVFLYTVEDPEVKKWVERYPFLRETLLVKARSGPVKRVGKFHANKAIVSLWDRADVETEQIKNLLGY